MKVYLDEHVYTVASFMGRYGLKQMNLSRDADKLDELIKARVDQHICFADDSELVIV